MCTLPHATLRFVNKATGIRQWCFMPFSTIYTLYIVAVSFIGEGNQRLQGVNHQPAASH